ncbi:MAG TPA: lysophospholipid acyltransferase family protein [Methylomirabilota bacterium]|nr:lysophospholipid acyltransferase family protein [Methylomirabilota bacterium]
MAPGEDSPTLSVLTAGTAVSARRPTVERFPMLYRLLRAACFPLLRSFFTMRVEGLQLLPASGPFILAANHHNYLDGVVLGAAVPRPIAFLVMPRVYHATRLHPAFHRRVGSIPLNLERPDPGAIKRALRVLADGGIVGIFPEGPFSREGQLVSGQPGVAVIALRSGVPVVPAAIQGTYEALVGRRLYVPRRRPLAVRFGEPMHFGRPRSRWVGHAQREDVTRRIMGQIASLLEVRAALPDATSPRAGAS